MINLFPFQGSCDYFPLILWVFQNVRLLSQLLFYSIIDQCAITCCIQHTIILCINCRLWYCFVWTCHMDWPQTHVTSEYFIIGYTTIVRTPFINKELSVVIGIFHLPHYPHAQSSDVQGSPHTWCTHICLQYLVIWTFLLACQHWVIPQGHQNCHIYSLV